MDIELLYTRGETQLAKVYVQYENVLILKSDITIQGYDCTIQIDSLDVYSDDIELTIHSFCVVIDQLQLLYNLKNDDMICMNMHDNMFTVHTESFLYTLGFVKQSAPRMMKKQGSRYVPVTRPTQSKLDAIIYTVLRNCTRIDDIVIDLSIHKVDVHELQEDIFRISIDDVDDEKRSPRYYN